MPTSLRSDGPDQTAALADRLGQALRAGDTVLLSGPIGAGKSHLCRHLIQSRQRAAGQTPEDVPSPSYTLVQPYAAGKLHIWHTDLYRLGDPSEVAELGLEEAFDTALVLVEWPDRLGPLRPARALEIAFSPDATDPDTRHLSITPSGPGWEAALAALTP